MIKFFRNDFVRCRSSLGEVLGRHIPLWIFIPYYVIGAIIGFTALPFMALYMFAKYRINMFRFFKN